MVVWTILKNLFKTLIVCSCVFALLMGFFNVKESHYILPTKRFQIRNDSYGDGHFAARRSRGKRKHQGIDLLAKVGEPIYATKSGWAWTEIQPTGYGNVIKINHFDGMQTRYAHLSEFNIGKMQWVSQGQEIGKAGKSGNANNKRMKTHLHFEIRKADKKTCVNPQIYIV